MNRLVIALGCAFVLTACGGSSEPQNTPTTNADAPATSAAPDESTELESAVKAYSSAFLTGDGAAAYALLSKRCKADTPLSDFAAITEQAKDQYGDVRMDALDVTIDGNNGTATYTYPVATLNQTDEAWVDEQGWKNDDC